jgi:hypothetical protein
MILNIGCTLSRFAADDLLWLEATPVLPEADANYQQQSKDPNHQAQTSPLLFISHPLLYFKKNFCLHLPDGWSARTVLLLPGKPASGPEESILPAGQSPKNFLAHFVSGRSSRKRCGLLRLGLNWLCFPVARDRVYFHNPLSFHSLRSFGAKLS